MEEVYLLWFLSISMLVCSFLSGLVPMALKLSDSKSRLLALLGSGILVGTALAIIIPEGIDALYGQSGQIHPLASKATGHHGGDIITDTESSTSTTKPIHPMQASLLSTKSSMTWNIGMSLVVGFVLMLLIDQFSIYQGGGGGHHPAEIHAIPLKSDYTLANQDDDIDIGLEEDDCKAIINDTDTTSENKHIEDPNSHRITMRSSTSATQIDTIESSNNSGLPTMNANPNRYYDHSRHFVSPRVKKAKVTPTLGLVIHAAADGIALGAAATTSHRDVEMIIFLAIMLHKAPAAFSLVVLLIHNGLRPSTIRKHLLAFSLSAPIAAVVTYYGLSQSGKEALRKGNATGIAMLFSAGTFLFVATVHVLPELIQNKLLSPKEMFFLLGGAFLPMFLAQTI